MARSRNVSTQTKSLLLALVRTPSAWLHGYALSQLTGLKSGTLYPLLMRLNDQGYLESDWQSSDQPGRPPRHVYRLTPSGIALARASKEKAPAIIRVPKAKPA